jgi:hypothetical protein
MHLIGMCIHKNAVMWPPSSALRPGFIRKIRDFRMFQKALKNKARQRYRVMQDILPGMTA